MATKHNSAHPCACPRLVAVAPGSRGCACGHISADSRWQQCSDHVGRSLQVLKRAVGLADQRSRATRGHRQRRVVAQAP